MTAYMVANISAVNPVYQLVPGSNRNEECEVEYLKVGTHCIPLFNTLTSGRNGQRCGFGSEHGGM